jgi:hypothetical protein
MSGVIWVSLVGGTLGSRIVFQLCEPELVYQYFYNYMLTRILGDYQATFPSRKTNFTLFSKENAQRYYFVAQSN